MATGYLTYKDNTPIEAVANFYRYFDGVLDSPSGIHELGQPVSIAGWAIPKSNCLYTICVEADGCSVEHLPLKPRPDVATRKNAIPLEGQLEFNGFSFEVPFAEELRISIRVDGKKIPWKILCLKKTDLESCRLVMSALSKGVAAHEVPFRIGAADLAAAIEQVCSEIRIVNKPDLLDLPVSVEERGYLLRFFEYISSADFLSKILLLGEISGCVRLPSPFSLGDSRLVGSYFHNINYLIFESPQSRFYIGQYLHSVDFVYFPDRSLVFLVPGAIYEHAHLEQLVSSVINSPEYFRESNGCCAAIRPTLLLNGISPYHFFYDTLPALHVAENKGALEVVSGYLSINSHSYIDISSLYSSGGGVRAVSHEEVRRCAEGVGSDAFFIAGVTHDALTKGELRRMDSRLVQYAVSQCEKFSNYVYLDNGSPIIWIGISAQKRALINQEEILVDLLANIVKRYPNCILVFDGMTSSIFQDSGAEFRNDLEIITRVVGALKKVRVVNLVGKGSAEKISIASRCDFFIANYSTGSMYPARFSSVPGVAHLSNAMIKVVKNKHIHPKTIVIPEDVVTDYPDPDSSRIDFVSYSIEQRSFIRLVLEALGANLDLKYIDIEE